VPRVLPALLVPALALLPGIRDAGAQVRRCEFPDGQTVYTDRRCETLGARERAAPPPGQVQLRSHRMACPRTLRDLYFEVGAALESRDVNRLASVYHWSGMSTRQGYDVMRRLQAIVDRPLVDLQPIWPAGDDEIYPRRRAPVGFRVEQTSQNGSTPIRAVFGLRRHLDCWWVTLGGAQRPAARPPDPPVDVVDAADADGDAGAPSPSVD
jgi:hypothetical protein